MGKLKSILLILGIIAMSSITAQEKERKSPKDTIREDLAGINLVIAYSQPSVKGREIFGGLVPWGNVWRAGANEATTFSVDRDVEINGQKLPMGKYALFILPKKDEQWEIIFNKEHEQWGAYKYDEKKDILRVKLSPIENEMTEKLIYSISDEGWVKIAWDTTRLEFKVE